LSTFHLGPFDETMMDVQSSAGSKNGAAIPVFAQAKSLVGRKRPLDRSFRSDGRHSRLLDTTDQPVETTSRCHRLSFCVSKKCPTRGYLSIMISFWLATGTAASNMIPLPLWAHNPSVQGAAIRVVGHRCRQNRKRLVGPGPCGQTA